METCPGKANFLFIPGGQFARLIQAAMDEHREAWLDYLATEYRFDEDLHCAVLERSALARVWQ